MLNIVYLFPRTIIVGKKVKIFRIQLENKDSIDYLIYVDPCYNINSRSDTFTLLCLSLEIEGVRHNVYNVNVLGFLGSSDLILPQSLFRLEMLQMSVKCLRKAQTSKLNDVQCPITNTSEGELPVKNFETEGYYIKPNNENFHYSTSGFDTETKRRVCYQTNMTYTNNS